MTELDKVRDEASDWLRYNLNSLNCFSVENATRETLMKQNKPILANSLEDAIKCINRFNSMVLELKNENNQLKSNLIDAQNMIIKTQEDVVTCKSEKIK